MNTQKTPRQFTPYILPTISFGVFLTVCGWFGNAFYAHVTSDGHAVAISRIATVDKDLSDIKDSLVTNNKDHERIKELLTDIQLKLATHIAQEGAKKVAKNNADPIMPNPRLVSDLNSQ